MLAFKRYMMSSVEEIGLKVIALVLFVSIIVYFPVCFFVQTRLIGYIKKSSPTLHLELKNIGQYWSTMQQQSYFRNYLRKYKYKNIEDDRLVTKCECLRVMFDVSEFCMFISIVFLLGFVVYKQLVFS